MSGFVVFLLFICISIYLDKRESMSSSPTLAAFSLAKENEEESDVKVHEQGGDRDQISAADYDPSLDRREDEQKRVRATTDESPVDVEMLEEEEDDDDDDVDDMFAVATAVKKVRKVKKVLVSSHSA